METKAKNEYDLLFWVLFFILLKKKMEQPMYVFFYLLSAQTPLNYFT